MGANTKRRKYKTRIIGALDIKSSKSDYCIKIKEDNLDLLYFPNFYSQKEAKQILNVLEHSIEYDNDESSSVILFGKKYKIPRKQCAYGKGSYKSSGNKVLAKPWKKCKLLKEIKNKIEAQFGEYNFCLINRYKNGNDRMGFHKDDESDLHTKASIAGISFGSERDIVFKHADIHCNKRKQQTNENSDNQIKRVKICLKNGSLLVMRYPTNQHWYHAIPKRAKVKTVRVSLTYRKMK